MAKPIQYCKDKKINKENKNKEKIDQFNRSQKKRKKEQHGEWKA